MYPRLMSRGSVTRRSLTTTTASSRLRATTSVMGKGYLTKNARGPGTAESAALLVRGARRQGGTSALASRRADSALPPCRGQRKMRPLMKGWSFRTFRADDVVMVCEGRSATSGVRATV